MLFIKSSSHPQQKRPAKKQVCIVYFNALMRLFFNRDSIPIVTMLPYKFKDRKRLNEQKKHRNFYDFLCIIHEQKSGVRPPEPFGSGLWDSVLEESVVLFQQNRQCSFCVPIRRRNIQPSVKVEYNLTVSFQHDF